MFDYFNQYSNFPVVFQQLFQCLGTVHRSMQLLYNNVETAEPIIHLHPASLFSLFVGVLGLVYCHKSDTYPNYELHGSHIGRI